MSIKRELIHHLALEELAGVISDEDQAYLSRIIRENPEAFKIWQETRAILNTPDVKEFLARPRPVESIFLLPLQSRPSNFWQTFSLSAAAVLIISIGFTYFFYPKLSAAAISQKPVLHKEQIIPQDHNIIANNSHWFFQEIPEKHKNTPK